VDNVRRRVGVRGRVDGVSEGVAAAEGTNKADLSAVRYNPATHERTAVRAGIK
jgi:hypothetical protein